MGNRHRAVSKSYGTNTEENQHSLKSSSQLKSLLRELKYDWPLVANNENTPLEMAIAFLDDTLVGLAHQKEAYDELCDSFGSALRDAVVDNYDLFNNSVGLFHFLLNTAQDSQMQAAAIGELIESSTQDVRTRTAFLRELDVSSAKYSETIEILDAMERLAAIPADVERLIGEKKIDDVYEVIAAAYQTATQYNLWSLSAMAATKSFLEAQLHTLYDMIVEEVKNEIYLRNFVSVKDSWLYFFGSLLPSAVCLSHLLSSNSLELCVHNLANFDPGDVAERLIEHGDTFLKKLLPKLHRKFAAGDSSGVDYAILLDSTLNSAAESYFYLYRLLCTAAKLNKLDSIVSILSTSLSLEIQILVSRVTEETKLAHIQRLAKLQKARTMEVASQGDRMNFLKLHDTAVPVLEDFFFTLFVACLNVLQRHRIVCEIVNLIHSKDSVAGAKRDSYAPLLTNSYDFGTCWDVILEELRTLVAGYIHEEENDTQPPRGDVSGAAYSHGTGRIHQVLAKKQLFSFEDTEMNAGASKVSEELTQAVGKMFPGFQLGKSSVSGGSTLTSTPYISSDHSASSLNILVPPTICNMRMILDHLLVFVAGSQRLFNGLQPQLTVSARDFFFNVMNHSFVARLREETELAFAECMAADSRDSSSGFGRLVVVLAPESTTSGTKLSHLQMALSTPRVYSNAVLFRRLFVFLCHTINTSFCYRRETSGLVLELLKKFAKSYSDYNQDLLTTGGTQDITEIRIGGSVGLQTSKPTSQITQWMLNAALLQLSGRLLFTLTLAESPETTTAAGALAEEEIALMLPQEPVEKTFSYSKQDLLDDEWFHHVCYLVLTALWVLSWLPQMRRESNYSVGAVTRQKKGTVVDLDVEILKYEYSFLENGRPSASLLDRTQHLYLTLNLDKVGDFDSIIKQFETVRDNALVALRYDLRLKALYHIGQSFRESFLLTTEPADCDTFILLFNKEIYFIGTKVQDLLTKNEAECVFYGLPQFINRAFIQGSELVKVVNQNGIKKILLNIFTTQQVLRTVMKKEDTVDLSKASRYFESFTVNEKFLLDTLASEKNPYSQREVMNLVRFIYSEKMTSTAVSQFNKTMYADLMARAQETFQA